MLALITVLSVVSNYAVWLMLRHDPYRDIKAPPRYAVEIPDLTFKPRGMV